MASGSEPTLVVVRSSGIFNYIRRVSAHARLCTRFFYYFQIFTHFHTRCLAIADRFKVPTSWGKKQLVNRYVASAVLDTEITSE